MDDCKCGCGKQTNFGRDFLPGHDSKLRSKIEAKAGGLFKLEDLVDYADKYSHGEIKSEEFTKRVRGIFASKKTEK